MWSGDPDDIDDGGNLWNFRECDGGPRPDQCRDTANDNHDVVWNGGSNLPNLAGRFALGSSATYEHGESEGEAEVTLDETNLPKHRHLVDFTTGGGAVGTVESPEYTRSNDGSHTHLFRMKDGANGSAPARGGNVDNYTAHTANRTMSDASENYYGSHGHEVKGYTNEAGDDSSPQTINNMPPYLVVTYIIRLV